MIERIVIDYLSQYVPAFAEAPGGGGTIIPPPPPSSENDPVAAATEPPDDGRFVIVEKTGGGEPTRGLREATLAVQCFGKTLAEAAQLAEDVIEWMHGLAMLPEVARCALNSSYNRTDDRKKQYRYQAVFAVTYY